MNNIIRITGLNNDGFRRVEMYDTTDKIFAQKAFLRAHGFRSTILTAKIIPATDRHLPLIKSADPHYEAVS